MNIEQVQAIKYFSLLAKSSFVKAWRKKGCPGQDRYKHVEKRNQSVLP